MASIDNLVNFSRMDPEKQREIARKGNKASTEVKRKRKTLKEELLLLLAKGDTQEKISLSLIQQAINGNVKAFEVLRDSIGEKEPERVINENSPVDELIKSIDDLKKGA